MFGCESEKNPYASRIQSCTISALGNIGTSVYVYVIRIKKADISRVEKQNKANNF